MESRAVEPTIKTLIDGCQPPRKIVKPFWRSKGERATADGTDILNRGLQDDADKKGDIGTEQGVQPQMERRNSPLIK